MIQSIEFNHKTLEWDVIDTKGNIMESFVSHREAFSFAENY
jgi:hypothetical protein